MNSKHLNITDHAVDRYRLRVMNEGVVKTNTDIRRIIIDQVKPMFIVLGNGVYPIQDTHCAYVIKNNTIVTIKIHHDIMNDQRKQNESEDN